MPPPHGTSADRDNAVEKSPPRIFLPPADAVTAATRARPSRVPETFRALRHRNYRLYFLGQLISLIGTFVQGTAMTWVAYRMTEESRWTALVAAAQILPAFFLGPLGGLLADLCPKRRLIFWTQAAFLVLALVLSAVVLGGVVNPWWLLVIALANGLVTAVDLPARLAFVMDMVGRDDVQNAVALNSLLFNGARAVGPFLGGLLLWVLGAAACFFLDGSGYGGPDPTLRRSYLGAGTCFLLNGLSYVAVLIALARIDVDGYARGSRGSLLTFLAGFGYLVRRPRLGVLILLAGALSLVGWPSLVLLPALARRHLGVQEQGYGLLLSGTGIGALVAALLVASFGSSRRRRLFLGAGVGVTGASMLGLALVAPLSVVFAGTVSTAWAGVIPLSWAILCCGSLGGGLILFFPTCQTVVQLSTNDENRGRILGVWSMVIAGALPLGNLLAGEAADRWGVVCAFELLGLGCALVLGALLLLFCAPARRGDSLR